MENTNSSFADTLREMNEQPDTILAALKVMFEWGSLGPAVADTTVDDIRAHVMGWILHPSRVSREDMQSFCKKAQKLLDKERDTTGLVSKAELESEQVKVSLSVQMDAILKFCAEYLKQTKSRK